MSWATDPAETAASYERVSRQVQALYGYGFRRQERSVDEMARDLHVVVPDDLRFRDGVEDNASGALWSLPDLDRCVEMARSGRFKTLLIPGSDRWTRDTAKGLWMTRQVREYGVRVVFADIPEVPEATDGNPYAEHWRQKMEVEAFMDNELEKAKIRWRTMNSRRDKAAAGKVVGQGTAPYGYRYLRDTTPKHRVCDYEVYEPEAKIVRELYRRALSSPVGDLLQWLQDERIPPPGAARTFRKAKYTANAGVRWGDDSVYRILTSHLYHGVYTFHKQTRQIPLIVTEDLYERVQAALAERKSRRGPGRKGTDDDEFLFRGRLVCEPCSARQGSDVYLHSKRANRQGDRYYLCPFHWGVKQRARFEDVPQCELPTIRAEVLEERAWSELIAAMSDPERLRADLQDARECRRFDDQGREDREQAIAASIKQQERLLAIHVKRVTELEAEGTDEADEELPIHVAARDETKQLLVRLRRDLKQVQAAPGVGISADEAAEIERLAAMVAKVGVRATPAQRRQLIELVDIHARVGGDGQPILAQMKPRREVPIAWSGALVLGQDDGSNSAASFLKFAVQLLPSGRLIFAA